MLLSIPAIHSNESRRFGALASARTPRGERTGKGGDGEVLEENFGRWRLEERGLRRPRSLFEVGLLRVLLVAGDQVGNNVRIRVCQNLSQVLRFAVAVERVPFEYQSTVSFWSQRCHRVDLVPGDFHLERWLEDKNI